jgi:hypothetical protein
VSYRIYKAMGGRVVAIGEDSGYYNDLCAVSWVPLAVVAGLLWFVLKWIIRKPNEAEPSL